ncbi:MAG: hypothetical protein AB7I18_01345 [Candidatus Berkiella sp.]
MEMLIPMATDGFSMETNFVFAPLFVAPIASFQTAQDEYSSHIVPCAAYDIGSGATKFMGALVNTESLTIEQIFSQGNFNVPYREDLYQSNNHTFSDLIQEMGLKALVDAHYQIEQDYHHAGLAQYGDIQHFAVATAAFRAADNGELVAEYFSDKLDMPVRIISQEEEGKLAYYSALTQPHPDGTLPIVWDIGGGSMQLTFKDVTDHFHVMQGEVASQTFQALVGEKVLGFGDGSHSPNPMKESDVEAAIALAKQTLQFDPATTAIIKNQISDQTPVLAVGTVHNFSIQPLCTFAGIDASKDHYSKHDLLLAIDLLTDKTDQQIMHLNNLPNIDLAKNQLTNLILVYAMMDLMGIENVQTVKSSNVEGLLIMNAPTKQPLASPIIAHPQELYYA